jgi:hypothetical protein
MASPAEAQQWSSQAALSALLRYAPQKAALAELIRAAHEKASESVRVGESQGTLATQAAQRAAPQVSAIYDRAAAEGQRGRSLSAPILAALSANSPFRSAAANEEAAGSERLAAGRARAEGNVASQLSAASQIPAFARSAAASTLASELSKLQSRGNLLQGEEGAAIGSEIGKLRGEANRLGASRENSERTAKTSRENSERSTETSEDNSERAAASRAAALAAKGPKGAPKPLSQKENNAALSTISAIHSLAQHLHAEGQTRAQIIERLQRPTPSVSGEEEGHKFTTKGTPGYKPDPLMSAGVDLAEQGGVSAAHRRQLEQMGYNVATLPRAPANPLRGLSGGVLAGTRRR